MSDTPNRAWFIKVEFSREHYAWIAAILLAGDIQARVVTNPRLTGIAVSMVTGEQLVWSNENEHGRWAYSHVTESGEIVGRVTLLEADAKPEVVARHIATFEYPSPVAYPVTAL